MKKIVLGVLIVLGITFALGVSSQSSWVGTDSMTVGSIIRSAPLKANLDYLFNFKVQKPGDCNLTNQRLAWQGDEWVCETYAPDEVEVGASCLFINGSPIQDGDSVAAFESNSVANGERCVSEVRTCSDGTLSGSFTFNSCSVASPDSCVFNGETVADGDSVVAFSDSAPAFGESCDRESRTCSDGTLSGSFTASSCVVGGPQACSIGGQSVSHGENITTYELSSVTAPAACRPQTRSCTDGTLSGTYTNLSCEVQASTCSSQVLNFAYTVPIVTYTTFGTGGSLLDYQSGSYSCSVPATLVPDSEPGGQVTYTEAQCVGTSSDVAIATHIASCGLSGWELSTDVVADPQQCDDAGQVVETRDLAYTAVRVQADDRCSCGASITGGEYGKNVQCAGPDDVGALVTR